jgi:NIMA (never in mitosis gene a)-related kinase
MKQIDIGKMSESEKKETVKEAKILEVLSHPNVVKFIEVFKTKNGKLCIVMDFADGKQFHFSKNISDLYLYFLGGDL